jgi:hypothetical protein
MLNTVLSQKLSSQKIVHECTEKQQKNEDLKNVAAGMKLILIENISLSPF